MSHIRNHTHPRVQAASRVREEGAPAAPHGPLRCAHVARLAGGKRCACGLCGVRAGESGCLPGDAFAPGLLSCPSRPCLLTREGRVRLPMAALRRALCPVAGRKKKQRHGEPVVPPRSLFDRATPGMLKMRREGKEQKKNILLKQQTQFAKPLPTFAKPTAESGPDNPEWLISEDWALLQVSMAHGPCPVPSYPRPRVIALGQTCAPADAAC